MADLAKCGAGVGRNPNNKLLGLCSQNNRIVEVGLDLRRSSDPTPLLKQRHLKPVAQDYVQIAFECFKEW